MCVKFEPFTDKSVTNIFFWTFAMFLYNDQAQTHRSALMKLVIGFSQLLILLATTMYLSFQLQLLINPGFEPQYESLNAMIENDIHFIIETSVGQYISLKENLYHRLYLISRNNKLNAKTQKEFSNLFTSVSKNFELSKKTAAIHFEDLLDMYLDSSPPELKSSVEKLDFLRLKFFEAGAVKKFHPLSEGLSKHFSLLYESGIWLHLDEEYQYCVKIKNIFKFQNETFVNLTLAHVKEMFAILCFGLCVGLLVFLIEFGLIGFKKITLKIMSLFSRQNCLKKQINTME